MSPVQIPTLLQCLDRLDTTGTWLAFTAVALCISLAVHAFSWSRKE